MTCVLSSCKSNFPEVDLSALLVLMQHPWPHIVELYVAAGLSCLITDCCLCSISTACSVSVDSQVFNDLQASCYEAAWEAKGASKGQCLCNKRQAGAVSAVGNTSQVTLLINVMLLLFCHSLNMQCVTVIEHGSLCSLKRQQLARTYVWLHQQLLFLSCTDHWNDCRLLGAASV